MHKVIILAVLLALASPTAATAGLWGGHGHGVDEDCGAMTESLFSLMNSRCSEGTIQQCEATAAGMTPLLNACLEIIERCPNGVSYTLWDTGSWQINCAP